MENCFRRRWICLLFIYGKLKAYGFSDKSLALMYSYLKNKKNRTQISNYLSSGKRSLQEFHKALSMNHYYLFYYKWPCLILKQCFLNNYADENNLYSTENNLEMAKMDLQTYFREITDWFFENMILNSEKGY